MSKWDEEAWQEWLATRPLGIQNLARRFPPNYLYRLDPPGQNVLVKSYSENDTLTVFVLQEHNPDQLLLMDREVFGIKPDDLTQLSLLPGGEP